MEIREGEIEGTVVSGAKVAALVDWPGAMMSGDGTGRLYFDIDTTPPQREALEALIGGSLGGGFSRIPELVTEVLPARTARIERTRRPDGTFIVVAGFGEALLRPLRSADGDVLRIRGAGGFRDDVALATASGSCWRDPDLTQWEGGGYAEQSEFDWFG